ncbi:MAG TPA: TlpA disulfide reductase family protein [Acidimicrobiales bacterium]
MTDVVDTPDTPDGADVPGGGDTGAAGPDAGAEPRPRRTGMVVSAVVAVVAVAFVAVLATREPATERRAKSPLIGKVTPALVGETLDGGSFDIDDHRDEFVVVNFFATWCPPCVEEHPELVAFDEAHRAAGDATVVSVVYDDRPEEVRAFFAERGGGWPVIGEGGQAAVAYGVVKVPETYLVAPGGVVVQKYVGGVTREMIEADMAAVREAVATPAGEDGS